MLAVQRRWLSLCLALAAMFAVGCADTSEAADEASGDLTSIRNTSVKRQTIGNCWLYTHLAWIEQLNLKATGKPLNLSESYLTYWDWFEKLTDTTEDWTEDGHLITGGTIERAWTLSRKYGLVGENAFVADSRLAWAGVSPANDALNRVNAALKDRGSTLRRALAARDHAALRRALNDAWQLPAPIRAELEAVFGAGAPRTFDNGARSRTESFIRSPREVAASTPVPGRGAMNVSVADILPSGKAAWQVVDAPADAKTNRVARRTFEKRVQRALNDGFSVPLAWYVDDRGLTSQGTYAFDTLRKNARERPTFQGGHQSLISDYEARNVPGFGTLRAGTPETRPAALRASLDDAANVIFFRVKNSWGSMPPTLTELFGRLVGTAEYGEYDVETAYLYERPGDRIISVAVPAGY